MWGVLATMPQLISGLSMVWPGILGREVGIYIILRTIHVMLAPYFALFLSIQMLTGVAMWLAPKMLLRARQVTNRESEIIVKA
jgi:thiosulfate reductase cytochrome b subunit